MICKHSRAYAVIAERVFGGGPPCAGHGKICPAKRTVTDEVFELLHGRHDGLTVAAGKRQRVKKRIKG